MFLLHLPVMMALAYLSGSVNYAVIVTRLVGKKDIRELDSRNPGAANVFRNVGRGWGLLVGALDALKSLLPILAARLLFFGADAYADFWALFAVGLAAVVGHMKPLYYGFRGGGGLSAVLGLFVFFVPVEYLLSLLLGGVVVIRFFRGFSYRFGRWTPIMSVVFTPFVTLALNPLLRIPLFAHLSVGGHPWYVLVGVWGTSLFMLAMNVGFLARQMREQREKRRT